MVTKFTMRNKQANMAQSQVRLKLEERQKWQEFHFSPNFINNLQLTEFKMYFTFIAQLQVASDCKWNCFGKPAHSRRISGRRFSPSEKYGEKRRPEIRLLFAG